MPFDALVMRAIEHVWQQQLVGARAMGVALAPDRIRFDLHTARGPESILIVLSPGVARLHRTQLRFKDRVKSHLWLKSLVPFTITGMEVPPFERIMHWHIAREGDLGEREESILVIELAGHLTNIIWLSLDHKVRDAWRRVPSSAPGRTIWPGMPYLPPPALSLPTESHDPKDMPPWARRLITRDPERTFAALLEDWHRGDYGAYRLEGEDGSMDAWVYPMPGYHAAPETSLEQVLDQTFERREDNQRLENARHQITHMLTDRLQHVSHKIEQYRLGLRENPEDFRERGDLWLAYQYVFRNDGLPEDIEVASFDDPPVPIRLTLPEASTPADEAQNLYRQYKKAKARKASLGQLLPALEGEVEELKARLHDLETPHEMAWYQAQLRQRPLPRKASDGATTPYRQFVTASGFTALVGRNREENARLTFQKARPDDIWLHTKQSPGSHVILLSGRKNPNLEDLLDAANLAVLYSSAGQSSSVPVDYTRRKYVRKRPHAEPGQVLYQREKTLYITPDHERLRRMGAMSEKLVDD